MLVYLWVRIGVGVGTRVWLGVWPGVWIGGGSRSVEGYGYGYEKGLIIGESASGLLYRMPTTCQNKTRITNNQY